MTKDSSDQDPETAETWECEFVAGFVGLSQDASTFNVKPEIGWYIKKGRTAVRSHI
jgi:hypothetical protein